MKPHNGLPRKFKKEPRYPHHRSEGMTWRTNGASKLQRKDLRK